MERISLEKLQTSLIRVLDADYRKRALIGPIIHQFNDQYYSAAINYIENGVKTVLKETYLTTEEIEKEYKCDYLEALYILNNIRCFPDKVDYIMHFDEFE